VIAVVAITMSDLFVPCAFFFGQPAQLPNSENGVLKAKKTAPVATPFAFVG
jgi:hypothetical protein